MQRSSKFLTNFKFHQTHGNDCPRSFFVKHSGWSKSSISSWLKSNRLAQVGNLPECASKKRLRSEVTAERSRLRTEQDELYIRFLYRRQAKGQEVDQEWLRTEMKAILLMNKPASYKDFKYSNGWLASFLDHYDITSQVQTEKKPVSNSLRVPLLQVFHRELCLIQQGQGLNERDPTFGRFSPRAMWNIDQIPASFVSSKRKSFNPKGDACWIVNQGPSGIAKRMVTLILTLRADGEQIVPPFLLFRGQGHLDPKLLAELDAQGIPYAFNEKAWANQAACLEHLQFFAKIVKEKCPEIKEHMLLLDGLSSQSTDRFIEFALDLNILPVYFPPNCTHLVQPVDHRVAAWLKGAWHALYKAEEEFRYDVWADYRDNGSMCPQYQRITVLKWTKICWDHLKEMKSFLMRAFISTGCLISLANMR